MGKKTLLIIVCILLVGMAVQTQAQGSTNPMSQILQKLDQILAIVTPPDEPSAGPVVLYSGYLRARSLDNMGCDLLNIGPDLPGPVTATLRSSSGEFLGSASDLNGIPTGGAVIASGPAQTFQLFRCEVQFVGFASNVRAVANVSAPDFGMLAVLEAR
jgi:hypothetical protein